MKHLLLGTHPAMIKKLISLAFLALAVGLAIPTTRAKMVAKATPTIDSFRAKMVPSRLESMANQLEARIGRGRSFPANWEGWLERDFTGVPTDPWDNYYYLQVSRRDFTVGSMGPDAKPNTPDDIKLKRSLGR